MNKSTKTSSFGVSGRIAHDSSVFYNSKLYATLPQNQIQHPKKRK